MTTINSVNNSLTGSTGTGSFVGSDSPTLTSADCGSATTLKIISNANPTLTTAGSIAIDSSITNFNGMLKYRDSTQSLLAISIPTADMTSPTNNNVIGYNAAGSKLTFIPQPVLSGQIVGYSSSFSTTDDTTTSTTAVDTSLTGSYTPINASNLLLVFVYGYGHCSATATTRNRSASYVIRRTTGTPANIEEAANGRVSSINSSDPAASYYNISILGSETAGNTSLHTYNLQHYCNAANATTTFAGGSCRAFMLIMEMKV